MRFEGTVDKIRIPLYTAYIGIAAILQLRTCVMKIVHIQGKSYSVEIVLSILYGTALKGKNLPPLGANPFFKEKPLV